MSQDQRSGVLAGLKVLVVEDEYFLAADLCRALRRIGAEVVGPFRDLPNARAALGAHPDLAAAVLDVNLDGVLVFPVADALRDRGVRFVLTTGYDIGAIPAAYRSVPRCEKPVDADEVIRVLAGHLASKHERPGASPQPRSRFAPFRLVGRAARQAFAGTKPRWGGAVSLGVSRTGRASGSGPGLTMTRSLSKTSTRPYR